MRDFETIRTDLREALEANDEYTLKSISEDIAEIGRHLEKSHKGLDAIFRFADVLEEYGSAVDLYASMPLTEAPVSPEIDRDAPYIDQTDDVNRMAKELGYDQMGLVYDPNKGGAGFQFQMSGNNALERITPAIRELASAMPKYAPVSKGSAPKTVKDLIVRFFTFIWNYLKGIIQHVVGGITGTARKIVGLDTKNTYDIIDEKQKRAKALATSDRNTVVLNSSNMAVTRGLQAPIRESAEITAVLEDFDTIISNTADKMVPGTTRVAVVDLSPEIYELNSSITYFFNLFDKAFGSNNEKLFDTEDLEAVYNFSKTFLDSMKTAKGITQIERSGLDFNAILKTRNTTAINIENLKKAYIQVSQKIFAVIDRIAQKHAALKTASNVANRIYSEATYQELKKTIGFIAPRVKTVETLAKNLSNMYSKFDKLYNDYSKLSSTLGGWVASDTVSTYTRVLKSNTDALRLVLQTIELRVSGISMYLKCLSDIQDSIGMFLNDAKAASRYKAIKPKKGNEAFYGLMI